MTNTQKAAAAEQAKGLGEWLAVLQICVLDLCLLIFMVLKIALPILIMCKVLWDMPLIHIAIYIVHFPLILAQVYVSDMGVYERYLFAVVKAGATYLKGN